MKKFVKYLTIGLVAELLSMLAFFLVSDSRWIVEGKLLVGALFFLALTGVIIVVARGTDLKGMIVFSTLFALLSLALFQLLGFSFFPGIVKDLSFLSWEHLRLAGVQALLLLLVYNFGGALIWWAIKKATP